MQYRRDRLSLPLAHSWFELLPARQETSTRELHALIMASAPQLGLSVRSGHLVYALGQVHVMALQPHRQHLHLQVFHAASLADRFPELEGTAKGPRQLRFRYGVQIDAGLVHRLVQAVVESATAVEPGKTG
jgi:hypothetical protein